MNPLTKNIHQGIQDILKSQFSTLFTEHLDRECQRMVDIMQIAERRAEILASDSEKEKELGEQSAKLNSLIENFWNIPESNQFPIIHEQLHGTLNAFLSEIESKVVEEQKRERFYALPEDKIFIKSLKFFKRISYHTSTTPRALIKFFKKDKSKIPFWNHEILLKNLVRHQFYNLLVLDLKEVTNIFYKQLSIQYRDIKTWEQGPQYNVSEVENVQLFRPVDQFRTELLDELLTAIDRIVQNRGEVFFQEYDLAGTFEYKNGRLSGGALDKEMATVEEKWSKNYLEWRNTIFALFEEWKSDLSIHVLIHNTKSEFGDFQIALISKLTDYLDPDILTLKQVILDSTKLIKDSEEGLSKNLKKINYTIGKKLDKELVPKLSEKLSNQSIINLLNKLEIEIDHAVESVSAEHVIVKSDLFDEPMRSAELYKVSLYELIAFETLTSFKEEVSVIKNKLLNSLTSLSESARDIDHIFTFSISSAIEALDQNKKVEEAMIIATEGIQRTTARIDDTRSQLELALMDTSESLKTVVDRFCEDILKLTYNENISQLRMRIAKAKASYQAEEVKAQLSENIKKGFVKTIDKIGHTYQVIKASIKNLSDRFILTAGKPVMSKEVSDFLLESQQSMDKLPLIYRRIYQIEPLEDLELFEGRNEELKAFKSAYNNWEKGRFAATAVLGEKWGGITTFINFAVKESKFSIPVHRHAAKGNLCGREDILQVFKSLLKNDEIQNIEELIEFCNGDQKRIIIIEDLQNIFLRKVHGFSAIEFLFELISKTSKQVFWVCSTTVYTWAYLCKTVKINDFFSYNIEMGELSDEQIVNLIWKRNSISGYNIEFEVDEQLEKNKKFQKQDAVTKQKILKDEFFSELNDFAKSNISLALVFWLLSTREITENKITIGEFEPPSLNFLKVLSMDKIYVLHALILHDGLSENQLCEVLNISISNAKLNSLALYEDGIIMKKGEIFMINPMVYRNTISLLKAKNLIH